MHKFALSCAVLALGAAIGFDAAAEDKGGAAPKATQLITLGTRGGPIPTKHRAQSANLLVVNGTYYLIDAGDGVLRRLTQAGVPFGKIGKIFITHDHDDHTAGLATLMSVAWDFQRHDPIDVYGPPGTAALVEGARQYFTVNAEIRWVEGRRTPLSDVFVGHDAEPGMVYQDANVKVTAVENTHFHIPEGTPYYGKYKSYSYRIETSDRVLVFTGDTGPSEAVAQLAKNADVLISEVGSADAIRQTLTKSGVWQTMTAEQQAAFIRHLEEEHLVPEAVGKLAAGANVKMVVLTHLPPTPDENDDYARFMREVGKYFSGRVVVAKDLMAF